MPGCEVGEQILLQSPFVPKQSLGCLLINDVSSEENFRRVDVLHSLGVDDPFFLFCRFPFRLTEEPTKILACRVPVTRLMARAYDNISLLPKRFP